MVVDFRELWEILINYFYGVIYLLIVRLHSDSVFELLNKKVLEHEFRKTN